MTGRVSDLMTQRESDRMTWRVSELAQYAMATLTPAEREHLRTALLKIIAQFAGDPGIRGSARGRPPGRPACRHGARPGAPETSGSPDAKDAPETR